MTTPRNIKPPYVEPIDIAVPNLPEAMEGFRILHLSDPHVDRPRKRLDRVLQAVADCRYELLVLTGDLMIREGDEPAAERFILDLLRTAGPTHGPLGVWGNHDTPTLRRSLKHLPIGWLENSAWIASDLPFTVLGVDCRKREDNSPAGDLSAALLDEAAQTHSDEKRFRLLLTHMPTWLPAASHTGIDLLLCGHTHAGQCRAPTGHILHNATPRWPLHLSSGLLRCGRTQGLISRGLGEVFVTGLRLFCRPHIPLITLRRATKEFTAATEIVRTQNI